jgi:hypothetical protein
LVATLSVFADGGAGSGHAPFGHLPFRSALPSIQYRSDFNAFSIGFLRGSPLREQAANGPPAIWFSLPVIRRFGTFLYLRSLVCLVIKHRMFFRRHHRGSRLSAPATCCLLLPLQRCSAPLLTACTTQHFTTLHTCGLYVGGLAVRGGVQTLPATFARR